MMGENLTEGVEFAYVDNLLAFENLNTQTLDYLFGLLTILQITISVFKIEFCVFRNFRAESHAVRP